MDRVAVIGCGGSGKSHAARELGSRLRVPVTHLDTVFYDRDWNPLPHEELAALQHDLVARPRWVIDGNYAATMPIRLAAADTVVFLDLPAHVCLYGLLQRRLRHGGGQHGRIGVYDRITPGFVRYIVGYRNKMRPRVRRMLRDHAPHAELVVLRTRRATRRYLDRLSAPPTGVVSR